MYLNGPSPVSVTCAHVIPQGDVSLDPLPNWPISGVGPGQRVYPLPSQVGPLAGGGPPPLPHPPLVTPYCGNAGRKRFPCYLSSCVSSAGRDGSR